MMEVKLTKKEEQTIDELRRLAKKWPDGLWLFSASGTLHVMKGTITAEFGSYSQENSVCTIDIPNDGGDW